MTVIIDLTPERMAELRRQTNAEGYIAATNAEINLLLDAAEDLALVKADNAALAETIARIVLAHDQLFAADTPARPDAFAFRNEVTRAARIITEPRPGDSIRAEFAQVKARNERLTEFAKGELCSAHWNGVSYTDDCVFPTCEMAREALAEPPTEVQG